MKKLLCMLLGMVCCISLLGCVALPGGGGEPSVKNLPGWVGHAVNVVSAQSYNDYKAGVSVLDREKIRESDVNADPAQNRINISTQKSSYARSMDELIRKSSVTTSVGADVNAMFASITVGFKNNASFEYSGYTDQYYYIWDNYIARYRQSLVDYGVKGKYLNYLSDSYLSALATLAESGTDEDYYRFFETYGTHLLASCVFGGRFNAYYSVVAEKNTITEAMATEITTKIGVGSDVNFNAGLTASIENTIKTENYKTCFDAVAYGGTPLGSMSLEGFTESHQAWLSSLGDVGETQSCTIVGYEGLIALWELLPTQYASLAEKMQNAFMQYYQMEYNGVIESFSYSDTVNYAGGTGTAEDPYLIANSTHLCNIEMNMDAHYKLIENIDLSGIENWVPLGGYYLETPFCGVLDGNGKEISGLHRREGIPAKNNRSYFGLFGMIGEGGEVKDVTFTNVDVAITGPAANNASTVSFFGVVAAKCSGIVSGVTLYGSLTYRCDTNGQSRLGGICGYALNARITNCTNNMIVSVLRLNCSAGGIVNYAQGGIIEYCVNNGSITSTGCGKIGFNCFAYTAGIVAHSHKTDPVRLNSNQNNGELTASGYGGSSCNTKKQPECVEHIDRTW
ncbi:MAG: hypothetical protein IJF71_07060 [Clostridia bacterium]|nr:hypothetical protein [Clostridia bacterium]